VETIIAALRRRYGQREWAPVTMGCSGARVFRGTEVHVKVAAVADLAAERTALDWLSGTGIPAPRVVEYGAVDGYEWLATTTVPGRSAAEEWPAHQRKAVIRAVAGALRALHAVPVAGCPLDRRLAVRLAEIGDDVGHPPGTEDPVVCHGDFCLPNVLLDPETTTVTGILDVARLGVADRYTDLALMARSIGSAELNPQYGLSFVDEFLAAYGGVSLDDGRIAYYQLLADLS
jgi:aminoglycoside phosphotransferase